MSDNTAALHGKPSQPKTLAELLETATPMGDLDQFAIDDLTPEDEDAFFKILEDA